jgi:lipoprotein-releasing system ATP-binding protein
MESSSRTIINAKQLFKSYGDLKVLRGVDLKINKGEIVSIIGKSGCGKSTLLHLLGTLDKPDSGQILIEEIDVLKLKSKPLAAFRNERIGFVFQFHYLLPEFSAIENVMMPGLIKGKPKAELKKQAATLLELLKVDNRASHKPGELSGGEQQRVAIARALINKPAVVFADEPSGNLDTQTSDELHKLIRDLRDTIQQTFVIVTHNKDLTNMSDRVLRMRDGILESE